MDNRIRTAVLLRLEVPRYGIWLVSPGERLGGRLLVVMSVLAVCHGVWPSFPVWPAGAAAWLAGLLLWSRLTAAARLQVSVLIGLGCMGLTVGIVHGVALPVGKILSQYSMILAMLTAVTFLRLVSLPGAGVSEALPRGPRSFLRTLLGVHLFGAVINVSTVVIVGDRLSRGAPMPRAAALLLSRGFSTAALWSPFFAAMALALTYSPGARLPPLLAMGIPLAACGLYFAYREALRREPGRLSDFQGYPVHFESLWLPAILGAGVLIVHTLVPAWSVPTIVTILSPITAFLALSRRHGIAGSFKEFGAHVDTRLPEMHGELSLFLAAGVLASGLTTAFASFHGWVPFESLTPVTASMTLALIVLLAGIGVHPVIGITATAALIAPLAPDPNLTAMVYLMAWGIGVAASPLSGLHVIIQGRYRISGWRLARWNLGYATKMLVLAILGLQVFGRVAGA